MASKKLTATNQPRYVYGYCRVSTAEQTEGVSLDEQQRRIRGRALELGVEIGQMFVEEGVSGSTPLYRRPAGERLLATVRPGDMIVAARLDRVFRSALDALQVIEDFRRRQISLLLLDIGDVSGNGVSALVITIMSAVAEFEHKRISERIKDAKSERRRTGHFLGGKRQFGYTVDDDGKLTPDDREQAAIREILALRSAGKTLMQVRDAMREKGFQISHQLVADLARRHEAEASA